MAQIVCGNCGKNYEVEESYDGKKVKCSGCGEIFTASIKREDLDLPEAKKSTTVEKEDDLIIKPHKMSYFILGNAQIILFGIFTIIGLSIHIIAGIMFLLLTLITLYWVNVKYKKEEYILTDRKIIYNYGSLISDNSVEINLERVTQVRSVLGFIQYKIFGTGNMFIKTAGSNNSKVKLKNFLNTMDVYENIQGRMKKNGFHLQKDKLVQTARPHWLGVVGEVFGKILASFIILFYVLSGAIIALEEMGITWLALLPLILFLIILVLVLYISYQDLKRRKYEIFTDSIFYTEGFLTKEYSFLPMESVADTENTQSFFSKIFGLHDVVVSSEGSNNKVVFKNMTDGEQMMKNIRYLKDHIIMGEKDSIIGEEKSANSLIGFKDKVDIPLNYDKDFTGSYKMSFLKTLFFPIVFGTLFITIGLIFFPADLKAEVLGILPILIALSIGLIIKIIFTDYTVGESSIESKFEFLSKKQNNFSVEKITGVYFRESWIDKLVGTCSVNFWSIGSSSSVTFKNIKKEENLEENILAKLGIRKSEENKDIDVKFNFMDYLKSSIGASIFAGISLLIFVLLGVFIDEVPVYAFMIFLGIIGLLFGIVYLYNSFYYSKSLYIQKIHSDFLESVSGIFIVKKYYSLFRHVKGLKTKKFPLTNTGNFRFDISGEQVVQDKNKKGFSIMSNSIDIKYVRNVFDFQEEVERTINGEKLDREIVKTARQDIGNSIYILVILYIFAIFLLAMIWAGDDRFGIVVVFVTGVFVLIVGLIVWWIKMKYYNFEKDRVVYGSGIIYKRRQSILYNKFNFIEKNQGFVNKIFRNGAVKIYTLGSGSVEMKLADIDNFKDIYELLKKD